MRTGHVASLGRRELLAACLAALPVLTVCLPTAPVPAKTYRIGFLTNAGSQPPQAFLDRLRELGWVEGENISFESRSSEGRGPEFLDELARELVAANVDLIVANVTTTALAAKRATSTIPIVVISSFEAVRSGLVGSLARPGGNVTGNTESAADIVEKRFELLGRIAPFRRVGFLVALSPGVTDLYDAWLREVAQAQRIAVETEFFRGAADIERALEALAARSPDAFYVGEGPLLVINRERVVAKIAALRRPAIYPFLPYVESGGLISYGAIVAEQTRDAADYVDKILKGARPGDLPVQTPRHFALGINLRTASSLGLTVPQDLLARADTIIR